jgi:antitoxin component YwqK of YwqJK toxin-antitoxin module
MGKSLNKFLTNSTFAKKTYRILSVCLLAGVRPLKIKNKQMKTIFSLACALLMLAPTALFTQTSDSLESKQVSNQMNDRGLKTGHWTERSGEFTSTGIYLDGLKDGTWETYYSGNMISKLETFAAGQMDGIQIQFDKKGKVTGIEHYTKNKLDGLALTYSPYSSQVLKEQRFRDGMLDGLYRSYYDNGKIQEEAFYLHNQKNGPSKWFSREGRLIAIYNYRDGQFEGYQRNFYENDTTSSLVNYVNNKMEGVYKEYYRNGKLKISGNYISGIKEGPWTEYDETGKVISVIKYKNGVPK